MNDGLADQVSRFPERMLDLFRKWKDNPEVKQRNERHQCNQVSTLSESRGLFLGYGSIHIPHIHSMQAAAAAEQQQQQQYKTPTIERKARLLGKLKKKPLKRLRHIENERVSLEQGHDVARFAHGLLNHLSSKWIMCVSLWETECIHDDPLSGARDR